MGNYIKPYIGISGFTHRSQIKKLLENFYFSGRYLMVGILVKTDSKNKEWVKSDERLVVPDQIDKIFTKDKACLNIVHCRFSDQKEIFPEMISLMTKAGTACHGIQINSPWPDLDQLKKFNNRYHKSRIILRIGKESLSEADNTRKLLSKIDQYVASQVITDLLFDMSGGRGRMVDIDRYYPIIDILYNKFINQIGVGVAGGLCGQSTQIFSILSKNFPRISIDAESKLREQKFDHDILDLEKAKFYLNSSLNYFAKTR